MGRDDIVEAFRSENEELTAIEIHKRVDINRTSVDRILNSMRKTRDINYRQEFIYPRKTYIYKLK